MRARVTYLQYSTKRSEGGCLLLVTYRYDIHHTNIHVSRKWIGVRLYFHCSALEHIRHPEYTLYISLLCPSAGPGTARRQIHSYSIHRSIDPSIHPSIYPCIDPLRTGRYYSIRSTRSVIHRSYSRYKESHISYRVPAAAYNNNLILLLQQREPTTK